MLQRVTEKKKLIHEAIFCTLYHKHLFLQKDLMCVCFCTRERYTPAVNVLMPINEHGGAIFYGCRDDGLIQTFHVILDTNASPSPQTPPKAPAKFFFYLLSLQSVSLVFGRKYGVQAGVLFNEVIISELLCFGDSVL